MRFCCPVRLFLVAVGLSSLQHRQPVVALVKVNNETSPLQRREEEGGGITRQLQAPRNRWCDNMWTLTYRNRKQRLSRINVKTGQWTERLPLKRYDPEKHADALAVDPRNDKIYTVVHFDEPWPSIESGMVVQEIKPKTGARINVLRVYNYSSKPFGIAINSKGIMYVSHWDTESSSSAESGLLTVDLDTLEVTKLPHIMGLPPRGSPWLPTVLLDIDFDPEDNLWALGYDHTLLKVNLQAYNATGMGRLRPRSRNVPDSTELHIAAISFHKNGKLYGIAGNDRGWNPRGMPHPPVYPIVQKRDGRYRTGWPSADRTPMDWAVGAAFLCR